ARSTARRWPPRSSVRWTALTSSSIRVTGTPAAPHPWRTSRSIGWRWSISTMRRVSPLARSRTPIASCPGMVSSASLTWWRSSRLGVTGDRGASRPSIRPTGPRTPDGSRARAADAWARCLGSRRRWLVDAQLGGRALGDDQRRRSTSRRVDRDGQSRDLGLNDGPRDDAGGRPRSGRGFGLSALRRGPVAQAPNDAYARPRGHGHRQPVLPPDRACGRGRRAGARPYGPVVR